MADYPQIQGIFYSWASLKVSVGDFETGDFAKVDWDDKLEPGAVRGTGPGKKGRTTGEYDTTASMAMYLDAATAFMARLAQINRSIGKVAWDLVAYWSEDDGGTVHELKLEGCRIKSRKNSNAPGTDATVVEFELDVMVAYLDGVALLDPQAEAQV